MIFYKTSSTFVIFFQNITLVNEDIQFKFWHKTAICFPKRKTTLGGKKNLVMQVRKTLFIHFTNI